MTEFLVDVNLPYKFKLWHDVRVQYVKEIDDFEYSTKVRKSKTLPGQTSKKYHSEVSTKFG